MKTKNVIFQEVFYLASSILNDAKKLACVKVVQFLQNASSYLGWLWERYTEHGRKWNWIVHNQRQVTQSGKQRGN